MNRCLRRLGYLFSQRRAQAELAEEIEMHRTMRERALRDGGLNPAEVRHASRRILGNVTLAREDARQVWVVPSLESVGQDVRYALRILRRAPAFGAAIVFVMALGIGATTGVFSLLDALVLRDLPVRRADRLVYFANPAFSYGIFREVRARAGHLFESLASWDLVDAHVEWSSHQLEPATLLAASADFFQTVGVHAAAGRMFGADDDRMGGGADGLVAVITDACWQRRFGRMGDVIGRTVGINGASFTIVGVLPPGFSGVAPGFAPELVVPFVSMKSLNNPAWLRTHASSAAHLLGRLRDPLTVGEADAALQAIWPSVLDATTGKDEPAERRAVYLSRRTRLLSGRAGFSRIRNQFEEPLWMLLALVGLLMSIACASAANLLIARAAVRRREIAVRLAIGAGRLRIVRQMLTETVVWTALAAVAGIGLAWWSSEALIRMMSAAGTSIVLDVTPGWRSTAFAFGLALMTAALAALAPAFGGTALTPAAALKPAAASAVRLVGRWSLSKTLVTVQVALTIVLLTGAAVFTRSLQHVLAQEDGIDRDRLLIMATEPQAAGYRAENLTLFYDRLLQELRALPGVEAASLSKHAPITDQDGAWTRSLEVDGVPLPDDAIGAVYFNSVSDDYFRTVGMRIVRGRDFGSADTPSAPRVVAINESLARRLFGDGEPLGRRVSVGRNANRRNLEIVTVVSDAKYQKLQEPSRSIAYMPRGQATDILSGNLSVQLRSAGTPAALADSVRYVVRRIDGRVPVRIETVDDRIRHSLVRERVTALLAGGLGVAALALACAALYGLLAYAVSRQTYEIGLRLALGAARSAVLWLVLRECLALAAAGTALGVGASIALARYVRASFLYAVSPTDATALASAAAIMFVVAALAGSIPARRAARVDPVVALRTD